MSLEIDFKISGTIWYNLKNKNHKLFCSENKSGIKTILE